ncbi:MAG: DUF1080 domain-containing protein [Phycisphaerales bacterium]|nr:MAG: DUF1080 domain-containing protein [Phycisphaerales bacterium]
MICRVERKRTNGLPMMKAWKLIALVCSLALWLPLCACSGADREALLKEATEALATADPVMGDWEGSWILNDETDYGPLVAQVIALGKGEYRANLDREFDQARPPLTVLKGQREGAAVKLTGQAALPDSGTQLELRVTIQDGSFKGRFKGQDPSGQEVAGTFTLKKTVRLSSTLGTKPPANAVVLFDGTNPDQWKHISSKPGQNQVQWKLVEGGAMEAKPGAGSIITKREFADVKLHLEFRTPFMPEARGQGRGNSGVYLQGRYEVQILDSYGLEGRDNECGGIYSVAQPMVNMCAPPTQWQTYDITFRAARFNDAGEKTRNASLSVLHNGIQIHYNVQVPKPTTAAPYNTEAGPGGIYLQDHGNPVRYRNIWLVELPEANP